MLLRMPKNSPPKVFHVVLFPLTLLHKHTLASFNLQLFIFCLLLLYGSFMALTLSEKNCGILD